MAENALRLIRIKDPNEALGLAVRLLAGVAPFREMPLGLSMGAMIEAIDAETYAFAARPGRAVGIACWRFCRQEDAETWLFGGARLAEAAPPDDRRCAVMMAMQASDRAVVGFLNRALREGPLRPCQTLYYLRDYGPDRPRRAVRLVRPRVRR